jgi:hypothetical protein
MVKVKDEKVIPIKKSPPKKRKKVTPKLQEEKSLVKYEISSSIDVLKDTDLIIPDDFGFLHEHKENFEKRLRTRSLFRSKFEMEASVLNDDVHPTPDSKYWQAIGEQIVHLQELISLSYENMKLQADIEIAEADLEGLLYEYTQNKGDYLPHEETINKAGIKKQKIVIEQLKFSDTMQKKTAKERMREITTWEGIITKLQSQLKYGDEDFELHHPERYLKRYSRRVDKLPYLNSDDQENVISHFESFKRHTDENPELLEGNAPRQRILPKEGHTVLEQPKESCRKEYKDEDAMMEGDAVVAKFFKRKTVKLLVGTPHRLHREPNVTNFEMLQPPAGISAMIEEPYGFSVADARNLVVSKAKEEGFDFLFFVDDDVIIPRNTLVVLYNYLREGDYDVASGFYYRKYTPLESCAMVEDKQGRPSRVDFDIGDTIENALVLCSGCTMFRVETLKRLTPPWYKEILVKGKVTVTEDTFITQRLYSLKRPKVKTILDTGVQCIHVDKTKGIFYGHPDIVKDNIIAEKYRDVYCVG